MTHQLTRADLLRRAAVGGAAMSVPGLFTALARAANRKLGSTLTISNWPLYIDIDEKTKKRPTIEQFQKRYGIKVKYIEDINDNASFFGKIQAQLARGQSTGRDIIVMTDNSPYPALLIQKGWVEKLDKSVLPNIKNLQDNQRHPAWDPNRDHSLPWQSGMTGIGYNAKLTKPDHLGRPAPHRQEAPRQGHAPEQMPRTRSASSCSRTATIPGRSPTRPTTKALSEGPDGGRVGSGPPVHRQRLLRADGEGRRRGPPRSGRATWCSSTPTTRTCGSCCRRPAG